jgi:hypothetical protein
MAVSARVVERHFVTALVALVEMAAEGGGTTLRDVMDRTPTIRPKRLERRSVVPEDLGDLRRAAL